MYRDLKEFAEALAVAVEKELLGEVRVQMEEVLKNNGVVLRGLLFQKGDLRTAPVVYLEPYYRAYREGADFARLAGEIAEGYQKHNFREKFQEDFFLDYEKVRETLAFKLVNYGLNRKLLEDTPHLPYLDLAMVFYSLMRHPEAGTVTALVRNSHLAMWNVTHRMLYEAARENTPKLLRARFGSMEAFWHQGTQEKRLEGPELYVLTNAEHLNGAASILYEGMLEKCAQACQGDFFLLPSSIHEVILTPCQSGLKVEGLKGIVREGNQTQVEPEEILSDSVYFYSREKKRLMVF